MQNAGLSSVALVIALSACGGGGDGGMPPPPTPVFSSLIVNPATPALVEGDTLQLTATPRDQNNAVMNGLPAATFALTSASTSVSVSPSGKVVALAPGGATVRATLTSGGTTHTATSTPSVTALGNAETVTASGAATTFDPDTAKIAVNGQVTWAFSTGQYAPHNVTFAGVAQTGWNIPDQSTGSVPRTFSTTGTYSYHCTRHAGMTGAVIVRDLP
ncbi:MAG: cupredoxin domain-containing protein [Gemmatimonadaceae bacterium]